MRRVDQRSYEEWKASVVADLLACPTCGSAYDTRTRSRRNGGQMKVEGESIYFWCPNGEDDDESHPGCEVERLVRVYL
jgi:hypothetical protein